MPYNKTTCRPKQNRRRLLPGISVLWAVFILSALVFAMHLPGLSPVAMAEEEAPDLPEALISAQQMGDSVNRALAGNQAELTELEGQLKQLDTLQAAIRTEIKAYESLNAAHGQLLLATQPPLEELEKALAENRLASKTLADRLDAFQKRHEAIMLMTQASNDRRVLAADQIANIDEAQFSAAEKQQLKAKTRELIKILDTKTKLGDRYLEISGNLLKRMAASVEEKKEIAAQLTAQLEFRQKASFYLRTDPLRYFKWPSLQEAFRSLTGRIGMIFSPAAWKTLWSQIRIGGLDTWGFFLAALVAVLALQGRCRAHLRRLEIRCEGPDWYYRCLGLRLLRRSLAYLGMTVLFGVYTYFQLRLFGIGLGRLLFEIFVVLLITSWGMDFLDYGAGGPPSVVRHFVTRRLSRLLLLFRVATIVFVTMRWIVGIDSLLTGLVWDIVVSVYLIWLVSFWRQIKTVIAEGVRDGQAAPEAGKTARLRGGELHDHRRESAAQPAGL